MSEPDGLSMSLDDLIKKRSQGGRGGAPAHRGGGRGGGGLGTRGGGVFKHTDRKPFVQKHAGEQHVRQHQQAQQHRAGGFGGRGGQQRRGGFGGVGGFGGRGGRPQQGGHSAPQNNLQTYLDESSGNVVVKLKDTEIVTVSPTGQILLSTGGWSTQMTLDAMNKALGALQIRITANGDVRDGNWQISYGSHLLRFYDGIILHPKNPATAAQRATIVLAAMTGAPTAASVGAGAFGAGQGLFMPSAAATLAAIPLPASTAVVTPAAQALAANIVAQARAALGAAGFGTSAAGSMTAAQQQYALAALAAQQKRTLSLAGLTGMAGMTDETSPSGDSDIIRRLKAQGRL